MCDLPFSERFGQISEIYLVLNAQSGTGMLQLTDTIFMRSHEDGICQLSASKQSLDPVLHGSCC